jgi:hypothetical protein
MSNKPANKGTRLGRTLFRVDSETYARFVELLGRAASTEPKVAHAAAAKTPVGIAATSQAAARRGIPAARLNSGIEKHGGGWREATSLPSGAALGDTPPI